jgi:hypothetical protein
MMNRLTSTDVLAIRQSWVNRTPSGLSPCQERIQFIKTASGMMQLSPQAVRKALDHKRIDANWMRRNSVIISMDEFCVLDKLAKEPIDE